VLLPDALGTGHPWAFHPDTRCCTYHPELPNYLAGQALERGDAGAEVVRARLRDRSGVSAWGIKPSDAFRASRAATVVGFGRDPAMRCPFYVGGQYTCGIWKDRNAVCRTWFCRHDEGVMGLARWTALRRTLTAVEKILAEFCVTAGQPPDTASGGHGDIELSAWEAWYVWCARRVTAMTDAELSGVSTDELSSLRRQMQTSLRLPSRHIPEVVVPVIRGSKTTARGVALEGYSSYDGIEVDPGIIHFFVRLDGKRTWREARDLAASERDVIIDDDLVRELRRIDILQSPARVMDDAADKGLALPPAHNGSPIPEILIPGMQKPLIANNDVWIQGQVPLASVIATRSIFGFLSRLDGATPWRQALTAKDPVDERLVIELYRIGALRPPDAPPDRPADPAGPAGPAT
jgi:hypothetical protein